jgi:ABC-type polysaccharide/polyol phosphate transport system ATPase subunit
MSTNGALIELKNIDVSGIDMHARASGLRQWLLGRTSMRPVHIPILRDVSVTITPGQRVGILGHNGSGKSSLLKVISGIYPTQRGERIVQGNIVPLIEMGAGFDPELTGRRNIKLSFAFRGRLREYSRELEERIIDFAELGEKIDLPLKSYSSGMQARLAFASAIFHKPDILLLDEILSTGDAAFVEKSSNFLMTMLEEASITVMVSHTQESIERLCNRCILLDHGRLIADGTPAEVYRTYHAIAGRSPEAGAA